MSKKLFEDAFNEWVRNKENEMTIGEYQIAKQAFIAAARYVSLLDDRITKEILDKADLADAIVKEQKGVRL